jgi:threonine dehydratase
MTREIIGRLVDDLVLVDEGDIEQAIVMLLEIEKTLVEGAGAAGLAALLKDPKPATPAARSAWCCAAATSTRCCWQAILERGMVRAGRLARIRVMRARHARRAGPHHRRWWPRPAPTSTRCTTSAPSRSLSAQNVEVELVLQTRSPGSATCCAGRR